MASTTTTDYPSVTLTATNILDRVNNLRNTSVTDSLANEIAILIHTLVDDCNAKYLKDLPIDVTCKPTNKPETELKSWYFPDLNVSNLNEYVISTFESLERSSYSTQIEASSRCIDAIQVLADYFNVVVLSRTDHYLELHEKKLDELHSSNSIKTSTLVNGDDYG